MNTELAPTNEEKEKIVAGTLAWCNEIRAGRGMGPLPVLPKGKRRHGASCPCGEATKLFVSRYDYYANEYNSDRGEDKLGSNPPVVIDFISLFDNGHLPEYDLEQ